MSEEYQWLECKKCGLSRHYPVKTPQIGKPLDWHCALCGKKKAKATKQKASSPLDSARPPATHFLGKTPAGQ